MIKIDYQPYIKRNYFFSLAEVKFYGLLKEILGDKHLLFPKVRISDLILAKYAKEKYSYFNKIKSKHVDFLICDKNPVKPKVIVGLDDNSHYRAARQKCDRFVNEALATAGMPIVHIKVKHEYNKEKIIKQIRRAYRTKYVIKQKEDNNPPLKWRQGCGNFCFLFIILILGLILR